MAAIDPTSAAHPALWDMALIHRIFRTGFAELARLVPTIPPADAARVRAAAAHLDFMLVGLRAHHTTEDEHVWPALAARAQPSAELVDRMEAQHHGIHDGIEDVQRRSAAWLDRPTGEAAAALSKAITDMLRQLEEHLDEEERDVVPLLAQHISVEEWTKAGQSAFAKFTPAQRFTATGQMLEVATPAEAAAMMAGLPAPVKVLWALVGRRRYRRYVAAFR
ncbi:hemerythrin domain-containing protein [Nocardioides bizhenqiangii]|uniref:Hemerythrin domain-containing protein n=1 Tax=Nocardioides bizhenqiangii TaxID=3095076 RepID=A0ABZ0ZLR2_9ACTN|nr:hemerythrin domain-containing protein [Nocardioides sp. HM61]WQQ25288.1 hemerythrin domain-containing protein [Nocardioides sp. HM61]